MFNRLIFSCICILLTAALITANTHALEFGQKNEFLPVEEAYHVLVEADENTIEFNWNIAEGYYLYQHQFKVSATQNGKSVPLTLRFQEGKTIYDEYFQKDLVVHYFNTRVTAKLTDSRPPLELEIRSQGCADAGLCYPPRTQWFKVDDNYDVTELDEAPLAGESGVPQNRASDNNSASAKVASSLPLILLFALLGGLILNLMPCVFPVLSLKALSFASSHLNRGQQHLHGWAYTVGVIGSFVLAAAIILIARSAGETLGWGFQLQQPAFVGLMVYLFFVMGLSLSGFFHIGTQFMGAGQSLTQGHSLKSSFFTGVLAALVASPCTAPLMAPALGYAASQPAVIALLVFIFLGFGMALPFLILSYLPQLANYLPKPGAWMEVLKQALAFPLYLTAIWLLWVFMNQVGSIGAAMLLIGLVSIVFSIWLNQFRFQNSTKKWLTKACVLLVIGFALLQPFSNQPIRQNASITDPSSFWQPFSQAKLDELQAAGEPVFVDFTADWCITCKINERTSLDREAVRQKANELGFIMLKGDWTNEDPEITSLLKAFDRNGVPLYLVYPNKVNGNPQVLPQILTPSIVLDAMDRAVSP